nr:ras-related protein RABE1c [Ipomoea batatas]
MVSKYSSKIRASSICNESLPNTFAFCRGRLCPLSVSPLRLCLATADQTASAVNPSLRHTSSAASSLGRRTEQGDDEEYFWPFWVDGSSPTMCAGKLDMMFLNSTGGRESSFGKTSVSLLSSYEFYSLLALLELRAYYRGAMGILLVYDVTDESSFNSKAVPTSKGQALADEYGIKFFETVSILEQPIKTFNVGFFSYLLV